MQHQEYTWGQMLERQIDTLVTVLSLWPPSTCLLNAEIPVSRKVRDINLFEAMACLPIFLLSLPEKSKRTCPPLNIPCDLVPEFRR